MEYSKYPHPNDRHVPRIVKVLAVAVLVVTLWGLIALAVL